MSATTFLHIIVSQFVFLSMAILRGPTLPDSAAPPAGASGIDRKLFQPTESDPLRNSDVHSLLLASAMPAIRRRSVRVIIYARYSTDQQSPRSIDDQVAKCRQHIDALGLGDIQLNIIRDQVVSGELTHRPGIDQVWDLIEQHGCDLIIAEDLSRLYRHSIRAMQLIESAVDAGIRVIAINSHIDTIEDESRWRMGAAPFFDPAALLSSSSVSYPPAWGASVNDFPFLRE